MRLAGKQAATLKKRVRHIDCYCYRWLARQKQARQSASSASSRWGPLEWHAKVLFVEDVAFASLSTHDRDIGRHYSSDRYVITGLSCAVPMSWSACTARCSGLPMINETRASPVLLCNIGFLQPSLKHSGSSQVVQSYPFLPRALQVLTPSFGDGSIR